MSNAMKVVVVAVILLAAGAVGWTLGSLLGFWGVIPAFAIGWLAGGYVIPRVLVGSDRV